MDSTRRKFQHRYASRIDVTHVPRYLFDRISPTWTKSCSSY
ncbi:MAG: hypothetical protein CL926_00245 [Deltaproteobacteria bacterium]|nr:hypothetical protein [Deltaproteobacteria bacterium]